MRRYEQPELNSMTVWAHFEKSDEPITLIHKDEPWVRVHSYDEWAEHMSRVWPQAYGWLKR